MRNKERLRIRYKKERGTQGRRIGGGRERDLQKGRREKNM